MSIYWIKLILGNFALVMFDVAVIFILLHRLISGPMVPSSEIVFRWLSLFALGVTGLYTFVIHVFFPSITAAVNGWTPSLFQAEVGVANLAFGMLGILSFKANYYFRLATAIGSAFWLWGDAVIHVYDATLNQNFSHGNVGSWLWMDILVPLILLICLKKIRDNRLNG